MKYTGFLIKFLLVINRIAILFWEFVFERISQHKGHLLRGILIGFAISIVVTILAFLGHLKPYENPLTDFLQAITYKKAPDVALLFITKKEYKTGFQATSPLSRQRLVEVVDVLIKLKAKVIALDIDISDTTKEDHKLTEAFRSAAKAGIPVVVTANLKAVEAIYTLSDDPFTELRPYPIESDHFTKEGFALFKSATPGGQWEELIMYGGVAFRLDADGIFRHAEAFYMIQDREAHHPIPSFPVAVAAASLGMSQKDLDEAFSHLHDHHITLSGKNNHGQRKITFHIGNGGRITPNFIGNFEHFDRAVDLERLLKEYGQGRAQGETIFKDKVVIVGGSYDKKDFYFTPLGRMTGMEIMANMTQSILSNTLITHTNFWKAFVLEVLLGTMVALVFVFTSYIWATILCFVTIIPLVVTASLWSFSVSYYWFDFIPTIAGVMLHGLVSKIEERT